MIRRLFDKMFKLPPGQGIIDCPVCGKKRCCRTNRDLGLWYCFACCKGGTLPIRL